MKAQTLRYFVNQLKLVAFFVFSFSGFAFSQDQAPTNIWPQWRGALGTGGSSWAKPPLEWDASRNIRWKVPIPGRGHSTPIVWKDRLFLTTAVPTGEAFKPKWSGRPGAHDNLPVTHQHKFCLLCINVNSGKTIWNRELAIRRPHEGGHNSASLASNSPVTDGEHVFAFFGSHGLFCVDYEGNVIWNKDFGDMHSKHGHGEGASPALYKDKLVINWDHEEQSFLVVLNKSTGKPIWRKKRNEVTSWSSPIVVEFQNRTQLIVCGTDRIRSYDLTNGDIIWECGGMSANIVATPVYGDGVVYAGSSYEKRALLAIDLQNAKGEITGSKNVLWERFRGTPYVPSPLLYDGALYFLTHYQGILTRLQAKSGEDAPGAFRLNGIRNIYASPVGADGRIYISDLEGTTIVVSGSEIPRLLAVNRLDEPISASLALVGNAIFLRGEKHLYAIAEEK